ncbi:MAG: transporter substrate-binding domain-containing protein [Desulfobacterium sp.]|nr:transporter substrate-binding domain-containing protein [Desulfobacterium sp.]
MKKFILFVFFLLSASTALFAETTIRITNGEWEPYLSEYSHQYGLASHIVSEAFESEGIKIQWGFFPWVRSYQAAKTGTKWDASAVWWATEATQKFFWLTEPVLETSIVFFHLKKRKFHWESIDDLKELRIGVTRGYDYGREFMSAIKEKRIVVDITTTDEQNFKKLLAGRIDIFPNDPVVGNSQIRNIFPSEKVKRFTFHPKVFEINTLNLIISKRCKNARLFLEKFNTGLERLKENGRLDQLYKNLDAGKYDKQKNKWLDQSDDRYQIDIDNALGK